MKDLRKNITVLKEETEKLISEKDFDIIEHFNDEYGAGFGENRSFNEFVDLYAEEDEGYFDPFDLVMDENDIIHFMQWRYRLFLIANMESITQEFEKIESGDSHTAIKRLEQDISDLRKYKKEIDKIIEISGATIEKIDKLIEIVDKHRK